MSGFESVDIPEGGINPASNPNPVSSLLQLLNDDENELLANEEGGTSDDGDSQMGEAPLDQLNGQSGEQEDPEQPDGHSEQDDETRYTVKVNGEEREVTLNELREGFQLKSDYTRDKQELANNRRALEEHANGIEQQRQQYAQMLDAMKERYETLIPPEPNWEDLAQKDPATYTRQRAAWDNLKKQMQQVEQERGRVAQEQNGQHAQHYQRYLQSQKTSLLKAKPDLAEDEKWNEFFSDHNNYAVNSIGFTPQEVQNFTDHRVFILLEKARRFDAIQNPKPKQGGANGAPKGKIPVLAPGSKTHEAAGSAMSRKAKDRLSRTGSTQDAASAIEGML